MSVLDMLKSYWAAFERHRRCRKAVMELSRLSEAQLRDIGIERDQIVAHAFGSCGREAPADSAERLKLVTSNSAPRPVAVEAAASAA